MNNKLFISQLAKNSGRSIDETQMLTYSLIDAMNDFLQDDSIVSIPNFGNFEVRKRLERIMISPSNKKKMLVPPKLVLSFKPTAAVKEKIKNMRGELND